MKLALTYLAVAIGNIAFFTLIYIFFPTLRDNLIEEDKFLENLTALVFLQAFIVSAINLYRFNHLYKKKIYLFIPAISLLGFLDELSFGERIFKFSAPVVYGTKIDAAHDLFNLIKKVYTKKIGTQIALSFQQFIFIIATIALFGIISKYRKALSIKLKSLTLNFQDLSFDRAWNNLPLKFCLIAFIFLLISTGIELRFFGKFPGKTLVEELSEANMAIGFLFAGISLHKCFRELNRSTELKTPQPFLPSKFSRED
ncbi:MAG: hypothetical protein SW833_07370 [Cyanobacteriota bacterium]|nr:hypothetical protein [Cyanobacteriota bacterium]